MFRPILITLGAILLAFGLISPFLLTQASVIGVENSIEVSNLRVENKETATPTYSMSIKNIKTSAISFFALVEVTYDAIANDVYVPMKLLSSSIGASASGEFKYDIKCRIFCNTDGSYRPGTYRAFVSFWKLADSQPAICTTDPSNWECGYIQIAPSISTPFTVNPPTSKIEFKVQSCYQVKIESGFVVCLSEVTASEGSTNPSGTITSALAGSTVTFTATPIQDKSKFLKWIKADGCIAETCKVSENTQNPLSSQVQNGQIYTAVFERIPPKPKLSIFISNPESCSSVPAMGIYEKARNETLTITITPAKDIPSTDPASGITSVHKSVIVEYTIWKFGNPFPDRNKLPPESSLVLGSTVPVTTKQITMDVDTSVGIACITTDVIDDKKAPTNTSDDKKAPSFGVLQIGAIATGITMLGVGLFMGGRKIA